MSYFISIIEIQDTTGEKYDCDLLGILRGKLTKFNIYRFRQGAPECNCADPFSISCPVHNKDLSESGPRSRAKEEIKEKVGEEEAQRMLNGHMTEEREEVIQESGKTDLFNQT